MALPALPELIVVNCGPGTGLPAQVRPKVHGVAQGLVALTPQMNLVDLSGLIAHGRGPSQALEADCIIKAGAIRTDLT